MLDGDLDKIFEFVQVSHRLGLSKNTNHFNSENTFFWHTSI
jgi:hypothetical protein